jgi:hypothetical protein
MTERVQVWVLYEFPKTALPAERKVAALFKWSKRALGMRVVKFRIDDPPKEVAPAPDPPKATKPKRRRASG